MLWLSSCSWLVVSELELQDVVVELWSCIGCPRMGLEGCVCRLGLVSLGWRVGSGELDVKVVVG